MDFQKIPAIEDYSKIKEYAFGLAKQKGEAAWKEYKRKDKLNRTINAELERIRTVRNIIVRRLNRYSSVFPRLDELNDIDRELIINTVDQDKYEKSVYSAAWTAKKIEKLGKETEFRIKKSKDPQHATSERNQFYARTDSLLKRCSKHIESLFEIRQKLRNLPTIKDGPKVAIAGFPNAGKSSLLKCLTGTNPKVASYPFTTTGINQGYINDIQLLDIPGTLDRTKKNKVEEYAEIIMRNCDLILLVLDPTQICGYSMKEQLQLMRRIRKLGKSLILVMNKKDIWDDETIARIPKTLEYIKISAKKCKTGKLRKIILENFE